jgi:C4-dicarboxylate transporter, DctQ subunit
MSKAFDTILTVLFWIAGGLLLFTTIGTCIDVIFRYVLNHPIHWMMEITQYTMLYIPFLGAGLVLKENGHVRIDLVLTFLGDRSRERLNILTTVIGGLVMFIYAWFGAQVTLNYFERGVPSLESLRTPMYIILMIIPIGSFFLSIQFFRQAATYIRKPKA